MRRFPDYLTRFMTLAADDYHVARLGHADGSVDRLSAVEFDDDFRAACFATTCDNGCAMALGSSRRGCPIVTARHPARAPTDSPIARVCSDRDCPPAPKHDDSDANSQDSEPGCAGLTSPLQRVRRMSVVHDHDRARATISKSPRYATESGDCLANLQRVRLQRQTHGGRCQRIFCKHRAN